VGILLCNFVHEKSATKISYGISFKVSYFFALVSYYSTAINL